MLLVSTKLGKCFGKFNWEGTAYQPNKALVNTLLTPCIYWFLTVILVIKESCKQSEWEFVLRTNMKCYLLNWWRKNSCLHRNYLIFHSELFLIQQYPQDQPKGLQARLGKFGFGWFSYCYIKKFIDSLQRY